MAVKLTKRVVDATRPGERDVFVWDAELKGYGVRVSPSAVSRIWCNIALAAAVGVPLAGSPSAAPKR